METYHPNELPIPRPMKRILNTNPEIQRQLKEFESKELAFIPYENIRFEKQLTETPGSFSFIYRGTYTLSSGGAPISCAIK